jgi:hypothetical protein
MVRTTASSESALDALRAVNREQCRRPSAPRFAILVSSTVLQTQHFANLVFMDIKRVGTCCICVTTSMGVSVILKTFLGKGLVQRYTSH